jgi:hypothetical protein
VIGTRDCLNKANSPWDFAAIKKRIEEEDMLVTAKFAYVIALE